MVLDALDILLHRRLIVRRRAVKKGLESFVPPMDRPADSLTLLGEGEAPVSLVLQEVLLVELLHHPGDCRRAHLKGFGDVADPGVSFLLDRGVNALKISSAVDVGMAAPPWRGSFGQGLRVGLSFSHGSLLLHCSIFHRLSPTLRSARALRRSVRRGEEERQRKKSSGNHRHGAADRGIEPRGEGVAADRAEDPEEHTKPQHPPQASVSR